jgi:hypothetical protein
MSFIIAIASIFCMMFAGLFLLVCRKLVSSPNVPVENDWLQNLSPLRYRPMERLLDVAEYRRLASHPAISRRMLKNIRSRRVHLFREYLRCLSLDYGRICGAVKLLMVQSSQDRADLASLLMRQRLQFNLRLLMAEFRLTLHSLGLCGVDAAQLMAALDSMRLELHSLMDAMAAPAGA